MSEDPDPAAAPQFGDLPEPFRRAVFLAAWRAAARARWTGGRTAVRSTCREARDAVDSTITGIMFRESPRYEDEEEEEEEEVEGTRRGGSKLSPGAELQALLTSAGGGRFPAGLDVLIVAETCLGTAQLSALLAGDWPCLGELILCDVELAPEGLRQLAAGAAAAFPALRKLHVASATGKEMREEGLAALADSVWPTLTSLELKKGYFGAQAMAALAAAAPAAFPALTALSLCECQLDDFAVCALTQGTFLHLEELDLGVNLLGPAAGDALADASAAGRLPALRELLLHGNYLGTNGVAALARAAWPRLESFHCWDESLSGHEELEEDVEAAVAALVRAGRAHFPELKELGLGRGEQQGVQQRSHAMALRVVWPGIQLFGSVEMPPGG